MKPILCKSGVTVEIEGRWFTAFVDCTIESIDGKIMVSDYEMFRNEPTNTRENTQEVVEVSNKHHPKGSSKTEVEILSQYTQCLVNKAVGKTVLVADSDGLVIFTDKSYLPAINYKELYDGHIRVKHDLTIWNLERLDLLSKDIIDQIKDEKRQLTKIKSKMETVQQFRELQQFAYKLGFKLTKE